jgi:hypothetical protein
VAQVIDTEFKPQHRQKKKKERKKKKSNSLEAELHLEQEEGGGKSHQLVPPQRKPSWFILMIWGQTELSSILEVSMETELKLPRLLWY